MTPLIILFGALTLLAGIVILVNPERHPHSNFELAEKYVTFLRGKKGQDIIRNFTINGEVLFYPDVIK